MNDKKEIRVNRCTICKTEYPLEDTTEICPHCDGEILFNVPKRKSILKRILDYRFTIDIKPKYEKEKETNKNDTDLDIKITSKRKKNKKSPFSFNMSAVKIALIIGIVILAARGQEGWGWLVFLLLVMND